MSQTAKTGAYLALITAIISGVSVYVNSFGVKHSPDPFVYTTAKNLMVGAALAVLIVLPTAMTELRRLSGRQWLTLVFLGLVGGSVPFLLFFYGLQEATAPSAALIHKTLFIWVAILAVPFLKENLGRMQILALGVLIVGQLVLVGRPTSWNLGLAELLILIATLFWAVEAVAARKIMKGISARVAVLGRMGFGSLAMLGFLMVSGRMDTFGSMGSEQWGWIVLTSGFLTVYVVGYYSALKHAPAVLVSSILVLGSVLTSALHAIFSGRSYTPEQVAGFVLILTAAAIWVHVGRSLPGKSAPALEVAHERR